MVWREFSRDRKSTYSTSKSQRWSPQLHALSGQISLEGAILVMEELGDVRLEAPFVLAS